MFQNMVGQYQPWQKVVGTCPTHKLRLCSKLLIWESLFVNASLKRYNSKKCIKNAQVQQVSSIKRYVRISGLNCLTIDYPRVTNGDISCREVLTEADLIWLSHPHKHTHTYIHMHGGKQPTFVICITHIQLKWLADGIVNVLWAALKCVTAWQHLWCAWISRCAWIVVTLIMGGVWRSCRELCLA